MIPVAEEEAPNVEGNTQISHSKNDPPQSFLNSPSSINTPDQIFEPSQFIMSYPEYLASMSSPSYAPDPSQQPRVTGPSIAANNPPPNSSSYLPYSSYRYAPSQDMYYAPYNPMPTSSAGIFHLYEASYPSNHPYNYNISSQSHLPPSQSAASIQMETAILRSFIEPNDKDSDRGLPPLSPSHHHSPHSTTRHHLEGTGGNGGDGGRMNKSNSNQNLAGSTGTHNNSNNSLNKSFDPLSIKDKICPDFLSDLFQDYINNQIQYQQPVANNFQEAHALMKNILIKKNVKDNLISYRTDTKRGKRDYKIKTYRITLIEGKGGIYFFSFGEIVTQQHPTGGPSTIPSQSGPASGVKKRRNTEDSLSSRKSERGRTSSSVDPPPDNPHESEMLLNLQNILTEDEEHLGYDLIQLDDMDQPPHHRHSNSLDTEGNHDDSSFLMNIPSDDEEPQRHRRKMSHDSVMECSSRVMSRENSHQSRLDQFTNAFSSSNSSSFPNKDYNFL